MQFSLDEDVLNLSLKKLNIEFLVFDLHLIGLELFALTTYLFFHIVKFRDVFGDVFADSFNIANDLIVVLLLLFTLLDNYRN